MEKIPEALIQEVIHGNQEAFREIYEKLKRFVYNVAYRVLGNSHEAEDTTQEVFVKLYKHIHSFKFKSSLNSWVYRMTVNTAINIGKKRSRYNEKKEKYQQEVEDRQSVRVEHPHSANVDIDEDKINDTLNRFLAELNEDQRTCIILRDIQGLSYEEISKTLNIRMGTVRSRLKRGRERLAQLIKQKGVIQ